MKRHLYLLLALSLYACTKPDWMQELQDKNPLKDSADVVSVYFRFDTVINDFEVRGILYPFYDEKYGWSASENGVRIFFHSLKTGKEYVWTDWDEDSQAFKWLFMSKNVYDIVRSEGFNGFHSGDTYIFKYDSRPSIEPQSPILPYAEYQFWDIDFDGENELLLNYFRGGPKGSLISEIYDITDTALILKQPEGYDGRFRIDENIIINPNDKTIIMTDDCSMFHWVKHCYQIDDSTKLHLQYSIDYHLNSTKDSIISDTTFYR